MAKELLKGNNRGTQLLILIKRKSKQCKFFCNTALVLVGLHLTLNAENVASRSRCAV